MTSAELIARLKKQPIGVTCGLICLLCAGWLYYRGGELEKRQAEYDARSAEAAKMISNVGISKSLPAEVAEMQAATKELESRLVKAGQIALNQQYFYKLEAENDIKLLDVRQNAISRNAKTVYVGVPFNVNIQGTYKNAMTFLQRVEKGRHFCRISNAAFIKVAVGGSPKPNGLTLSLSFELLGQP